LNCGIFSCSDKFIIKMNQKKWKLRLLRFYFLCKIKNVFVVVLCTAVLKTPLKCLADFCPTVITSVFAFFVTV